MHADIILALLDIFPPFWASFIGDLVTILIVIGILVTSLFVAMGSEEVRCSVFAIATIFILLLFVAVLGYTSANVSDNVFWFVNIGIMVLLLDVAVYGWSSFLKRERKSIIDGIVVFVLCVLLSLGTSSVTATATENVDSKKYGKFWLHSNGENKYITAQNVGKKDVMKGEEVLIVTSGPYFRIASIN
jgi:peptidoglycan/LPS O-acetylase OafA/YrhL